MVAAWVLFAAITALPADPLIQGRSVAPDNEPKAENIDRQPVAVARGRDVETRRDEDGRLYTRQEFLAVYNDTEEWETAGRHERRKGGLSFGGECRTNKLLLFVRHSPILHAWRRSPLL